MLPKTRKILSIILVSDNEGEVLSAVAALKRQIRQGEETSSAAAYRFLDSLEKGEPQKTDNYFGDYSARWDEIIRAAKAREEARREERRRDSEELLKRNLREAQEREARRRAEQEERIRRARERYKEATVSREEIWSSAGGWEEKQRRWNEGLAREAYYQSYQYTEPIWEAAGAAQADSVKKDAQECLDKMKKSREENEELFRKIMEAAKKV